MAVTRKAMDPADGLKRDQMSVRRTVTNYLEVFGTCRSVGNVGLEGCNKRNLPNGEMQLRNGSM